MSRPRLLDAFCCEGGAHHEERVLRQTEISPIGAHVEWENLP